MQTNQPEQQITDMNSDLLAQPIPTDVKKEETAIDLDGPVISETPVEETTTNKTETTQTPVMETSEEKNTESEEAKQTEPQQEVIKSKHIANTELLVDYNIPNALWDDAADTFILPSLHEDDLTVSLQRSPNVKIGTNKEDQNWSTVIKEGTSNATYADMLSKALERKDSDYKQYISAAGVNLAPASPRFKSTENQTLKGEAAVIRMTSFLGMGSLFQVPLWHSGFWITFKPPTEASLIELQRILMSDKIQFGRYSYGRLYSGLTAFTVDRLVNFAIDHIYDSTVKSSEITFAQMKDYIALEDIFPMLWGFMATVYPKGFQYERACANDPEKCRHVVHEKLNLARLLWTDNSSLTDWQRVHMASRSSQSKDKESILKYRQELLRVNDHRYKINSHPENEIHVTFQIGFIREYVEASYKWIQEITDTVEMASSKDITAEEKEAFITSHGKSSTLRQSTHQVKSIEFDSNIIEDKETIEETLNVLSADDKLVSTFFNNLNEFNNNATISVVGIPTYNCPKCGQEQKSNLENKNFVNIIPLDVIQLFFDLITQRIQKINLR